MRVSVLIFAISLAACSAPRFASYASSASTLSLAGHRHTVTSLAITPDGRLLASGSRDGTVRLWDLPQGDLLGVLRGHSTWVSIWAIAISADGKRLASASDDLTIRVWELSSRRTVAILRGHSESIRAVGWSPDGRLIASASRDETVRLWDTESGKEVARLPHGNTVRAVVFSPDGKTIISGGADDLIRLWNVATRKLDAVLPDHSNTIQALAVSPDGHTLASGSADKTILLWDLASLRVNTVLVASRLGKPPTRWERYGIDPGAEVLGLAISPRGDVLASAHRGSPIHLWQLPSGRSLHLIPSPAESTYALVFSPDGRWLISGGDDRIVRLWDLSSRTQAELGGG